ncbi:hypothetical protein B0I37DRAFT_175366 [Chaetomium sp. MPI-CAGE-AT-0009]|nr:hypothetical protein B0I37DRAFT_175366 [Chaetomium sp. MPI-CAGE-AT-0009]
MPSGERVWQSESVASRDVPAGNRLNSAGWKHSPARKGQLCQIAQCLTQFFLSQAGNQERRGRRDLGALIRPPKSIRHRRPTHLTVFFLRRFHFPSAVRRRFVHAQTSFFSSGPAWRLRERGGQHTTPALIDFGGDKEIRRCWLIASRVQNAEAQNERPRTSPFLGEHSPRLLINPGAGEQPRPSRLDGDRPKVRRRIVDLLWAANTDAGPKHFQDVGFERRASTPAVCILLGMIPVDVSKGERVSTLRPDCVCC